MIFVGLKCTHALDEPIIIISELIFPSKISFQTAYSPFTKVVRCLNLLDKKLSNKNEIQIIGIKKSNMFCVGMWISTLPSGKQGSAYDRVWDIFSFKLLTQKQHMFSSNSQMIIPPSRTMREAMFDNQFPIAYSPAV